MHRGRLPTHHTTLWRVGDCHWSFEGRPHLGHMDINVVTSGMRAAIVHSALLDGADPELLRATDPGRDAIAGLLRQQKLFANTLGPFGYGVINGAPVPDQYVEVEPLTGTGRLVMTSDGYPALLPTLAESEAYLAMLLDQDPLCINELRGTKALSPGADSFDDRTWVSIDI